MNLSFLFLLSPVVFLQISSEIIFSLIMLGFSSLLYHNRSISDMFNYNSLYMFDQINIINTCTIISFESFPLAVHFMSMYLLEQFLFRTCYTCLFVYFISFVNVISNANIALFFMNSCLYLNSQGRDFTDCERYLWHFLQGLYIFLTLKRNFPFRFDFFFKHRIRKSNS